MALLSEPSEPEALAGKCTGWCEALEVARGARVKLWNLGFIAGIKCQPAQHTWWKMTGNSGLSCFKKKKIKMLRGVPEACIETIDV